MARKKSRFKQSGSQGANVRWWHIVLVMVIIAAMFWFLERVKSRYQKTASIKSAQVEAPVIQGREEYPLKPYTSAQTAPPKKSVHGPLSQMKGTVAVIVDDMGSSSREVNELLAINLPITFALIPGLPRVRAVADAADSAGREVMVHIPMEPQGYPKQRLETNGLLVSYSEDELTRRSVELIKSVPHAKGANNHMGSRFTEQEEKMLPVLKVLKNKGMFFVDSRTSPNSAAASSAQRLGIKSATRNVFLDNEQDVGAIKKQLHAAAEMSRKNGGVIAICHPHGATIKALKEGMPELQARGITFVSAGELVR